MKHACWKTLLAALVCLTLLAGCKKAEAVGPTAGATFVESAALFSDEEEGTLSPKAIAAQEEKEAAEKAAQETGGSGAVSYTHLWGARKHSSKPVSSGCSGRSTRW